MGRAWSNKSVLNYVVVAVVVVIGYKVLFGGPAKKSANPFRDTRVEHPKNVKPRPLDDAVIYESRDQDVAKDDPDQKEAGKPNIDVGDIPKDLDDDTLDDLKNQKEKKAVKDQFEKRSKQPVEKKVFGEDGVDWQLEEEMTKRRASFFKEVADREVQVTENEMLGAHESHDNFAFVTAGSHSTYPATIQFIYSVQYFYPESPIAIYDIGLTSDEKLFISSLCNTEVVSLWLQLWPESLYKNRHRVWRPMLLQFALAKYGHLVYVEPGRYVFKQGIKDFIHQSRVHGLVFGGTQLKYSTYVVTNPHTFTFIPINEKKLQKVPHFDFNLIVIHNSGKVINSFIRYLISCVMEEYCISPPGSKPSCDIAPDTTKRYARCHRYDESVINLLMNKWHEYKPREYLIKDSITKYYDGKDLTKRVSVCNHKKDEV
ncbi:uncharacterized protein LOC131954802 [Physella acuta]|uniref:uncharacterized protein LOC131954802 n=1 Tax=Physella acuta TaxID=109671 RepID=UPI0027DCA1D7|nr:uncharacterized protein LOC131954802 [Physella acuta]XP_059174576.1 uncharacterized protein LOC131954802 [Physella acuta]